MELLLSYLAPDLLLSIVHCSNFPFFVCFDVLGLFIFFTFAYLIFSECLIVELFDSLTIDFYVISIVDIAWIFCLSFSFFFGLSSGVMTLNRWFPFHCYSAFVLVRWQHVFSFIGRSFKYLLCVNKKFPWYTILSTSINFPFFCLGFICAFVYIYVVGR